MQYRLSTLFLIFFNVAASLALFGAWGIWAATSLMLAALCLNHVKNLWSASAYVLFLIFIGIICPGFISLAKHAREEAKTIVCMNNLKQIGLALHNYHDTNKHFPSANICDKNGKPLFSWRVAILPMMEYGSLYDALKKDEPWNSPHNTKVLSQVQLGEYQCPSAHRDNNDCFTNYIAVIGPGTAWREDGTVKLSDLPYNGNRAVMAIEVVNSGVHWAEPRDLTVEEALDRMKTGKGFRISTAHPHRIAILFADGHVSAMPSKMSISMWRKILAGDIGSIEEYTDNFATDMVDVYVDPPDNAPGKWPVILGLIVWLLSVVLLFRRAIKSRRKSQVAT
jgi:prepilin-type processing-associated H-X9-DG protein